MDIEQSGSEEDSYGNPEDPMSLDHPNMDVPDALSDELSFSLDQIDDFCDLVGGSSHAYWSNSELGSDSDAFDGDTPGECARLAAIVSFDHLHYFAKYCVTTRRISAFAPYTVVRSALTAACTSAWILEDLDPIERRRRALIFRYQDAINKHNAAAEIASTRLPDNATEKSRKRRRGAAKRRAEALSEINQIKMDATNSGISESEFKKKPHDAQIIEIGAALIGDHEMFDGFEIKNEVLLHWRSLSASAHGQPWAARMSAETLIGPDGVPVGRWSPNHSLLMAGFRLTWLTLHGMWERYQHLAASPDVS